jgi:hypothetical protein
MEGEVNRPAGTSVAKCGLIPDLVTNPLRPADLALERKDEPVFSVTLSAVRLGWERLRKRAGLEDQRLNDLRHESNPAALSMASLWPR